MELKLINKEGRLCANAIIAIRPPCEDDKCDEQFWIDITQEPWVVYTISQDGTKKWIKR
jgi:hypothetical protein